MRLADICDEVRNIQGERPSVKVVWAAVQRMESAQDGLPQGNCREQLLSPAQQDAVVEFVKKRRAKRFCTCKYIAKALVLGEGDLEHSTCQGTWCEWSLV